MCASPTLPPLLTTYSLQIFSAYCERKALSINDVRFIGPEGERLQKEKTVADSGLEDEDIIDVQQEMARSEGGTSRFSVWSSKLVVCLSAQGVDIS